MKTTVLDQLVGTPDAAREDQAKRKRVAQAKKDFAFFCRTYLSDYFFTESADYQKVLYDVADSQALKPETIEALKGYVREQYRPLLVPTDHLAGALFMEPREHGKTVRWSFAYALWRVLSGRTRYVLLIGASQTAAAENLINIRTELEENDAILADFGDLKGDRWSDARIELTLGACIQAKGAGMSMRGTRFRQYRPDLIILDDVLKDDSVESPTIRQKIYRWLKRVVFNLGKTAFIIWVNTVFHNDDPPSRLMREISEGRLPRWIAVRLSCWMPDGVTPLWPENWPAELLKEKRETIGVENFSTEYENEPLSDEERIIRREWIEGAWYESEARPPLHEMRVFGGVDPAAGKHDRTAIVTVGVDRQGRMWELDSWARTCSELETVRQLIEKHRLFRYELIAWEEVSFSAIYANYVIDMAAQAGVHLPIKKVKAGTESKAARIRGISPLLENGVLRVRSRGAAELIEELTTFPKGRFDDLCDGLAYAVGVASRGPGAPLVMPVARRLASPIIKALRGFRK